MGNVKITYNGTQLSEEEISGDASITYNGSAIGTCAEGETKTLNCSGLYMNGNVVIGGKTLNCVNNIMAGNVVITNTALSKPYLAFKCVNNFTLSITDGSTTGTSAKHWDGTMQYSTDASTWSTWSGANINAVKNGDYYYIYLRGISNTRFATGNSAGQYTQFKFSASPIIAEGNIENILNYVTVSNGNHPTMAVYCFDKLFNACSQLQTPPELGAITLSQYCYNFMFESCTGLTSVPKLPSTAMQSNCYHAMFDNCRGLVSIPVDLLPATTMAYNCYNSMFSDCRALTNVCRLPATTLAANCYVGMFFGCKVLTELPKLPATDMQNYSYQNMFKSCSLIKLSTTQTGIYQYAYRIPVSGTGSQPISGATPGMFASTGGTFTGTPSINTTYYTDHEPV